MELYLIIFLLAVLSLTLQQKKNYAAMNIAVLTLMFLLSAFRGPDVGKDTTLYLHIYSIKWGAEEFENEFLFSGLLLLKHALRMRAEDIQVIMSALFYVPFTWLIVKESKWPALSVVVFVIGINGYFFETFNIVRQLVSIAFLMWGYYFLERKKWPVAIIFGALAMGFHVSAAVFIAAAIVAYFCHFSKRTVNIVIIGTLIFGLGISSIGFWTGMIHKLAGINLLGIERYVRYATFKLDLARNFSGLVVLLVPMSVLCIYCYSEMEKENFYMKAFFFGCVLLNLVSIMPTSYRMAMGLTCLDLLLFPMALKSEGRMKYIPWGMLGLMLIYWLAFTLPNAHKALLVPYDTFL